MRGGPGRSHEGNVARRALVGVGAPPKSIRGREQKNSGFSFVMTKVLQKVVMVQRL